MSKWLFHVWRKEKKEQIYLALEFKISKQQISDSFHFCLINIHIIQTLDYPDLIYSSPKESG